MRPTTVLASGSGSCMRLGAFTKSPSQLHRELRRDSGSLGLKNSNSKVAPNLIYGTAVFASGSGSRPRTGALTNNSSHSQRDKRTDDLTTGTNDSNSKLDVRCRQFTAPLKSGSGSRILSGATHSQPENAGFESLILGVDRDRLLSTESSSSMFKSLSNKSLQFGLRVSPLKSN